jgi:hypothetical protein
MCCTAVGKLYMGRTPPHCPTGPLARVRVVVYAMQML